MIHLDTHVAAWLHDGDLGRMPLSVQQLLEREELRISPMVVLELQYLHEIGRRRSPAEAVVTHLSQRIGLRIADTGFPAVVARALGIAWTRDPFDRMIVAQSLEDGCPLITRDERIREHCASARWEDAS